MRKEGNATGKELEQLAPEDPSSQRLDALANDGADLVERRAEERDADPTEVSRQMDPVAAPW